MFKVVNPGNPDWTVYCEGVREAKQWVTSIQVVKSSRLLPKLLAKSRRDVDVIIRRSFGEPIGMDIVGGSDNECGPLGIYVTHIIPEYRK